MAGGTTNWIMSTKLKRGSDGSNPKAAAPLTTPIAITGRIKYRITIIVMMVTYLMFEFLKPVKNNQQRIYNPKNI